MAMNQLIPVASAATMEAEDKARKDAAEKRQNSPFVQSLAAHAKKRWAAVRDSRSAVEERLAKALRQRNGEYDPEKLVAIQEQGGSEIFMNLTSVKCRGASSWLRDTLLGTGADKPWQLEHTPVPELPPDVVARIQANLTQQVTQFMMQSGGQEPQREQVMQLATQMKEQTAAMLADESKKRVERMELKMEDQLTEGGFTEALSQFIDDIVTFPSAILKGPVARKRKTLKWNGTVLEPTEAIRMEWERTDPFKFYPAKWASNVNDGFVVERHQMTRSDLEALIGVEGYSEDDIRAVLSEFDSGGLREWLSVDVAQAGAEGKDSDAFSEADVIDAIQLWDEASGKMLKEWGMDGDEAIDEDKAYPCEIWLIGTRVIKAVLNYDPLGRKPYFVTSYEKIPGAFWGNGVPDLIRDCQQMCNAAARALSNNMGIASGPQVGVNVSRLPPGEKISQMRPWQIWQFQNTDYQDATKPIEFFQPPSNASELLGVFEKFMILADEYSGIPRYMTGESAPGAGRTASGLSMLISNASKGLKQVINNIDKDCLTPMLERQYQHNLRYSQDPDLIGDVNIVAKGAMSLVAKESAAVRRNEFLQLALNSPVVQQIIGLPGTAELLRDAAKQLDLSVDNIVPNQDAIQKILEQQNQQAQVAQQAALQPSQETIQFQKDETGAVIGATKQKFINPGLDGKNTQGSSFALPQPPAPKAEQADGTPQGGREGSLMHNRVTGSNGLGGR